MALARELCQAAVLGALGGSGYVIACNVYRREHKGVQSISYIADLAICRFLASDPKYQAGFLAAKSILVYSSTIARDPLKTHAHCVFLGAVIGVIGKVSLNMIQSIRF